MFVSRRMTAIETVKLNMISLTNCLFINVYAQITNLDNHSLSTFTLDGLVIQRISAF